MKADLKLEIKLLQNGNLHVVLDDQRPSFFEDWNRELTVDQFLNDLKDYIALTHKAGLNSLSHYNEEILKKEIEELEEKRDNCTITEEEEKRLTYLIWKYTNP